MQEYKGNFNVNTACSPSYAIAYHYQQNKYELQVFYGALWLTIKDLPKHELMKHFTLAWVSLTSPIPLSEVTNQQF